MKEEKHTPARMIRWKEMLARVALSDTSARRRLDPRSTQYDPTFPRPIKLSANRLSPRPQGAVGFLEADVDKWLLSITQKQVIQ